MLYILLTLGRHYECTATHAGFAVLKQILAVDVLTGKAKEMKADSSMRNPPKIEDESIGK